MALSRLTLSSQVWRLLQAFTFLLRLWSYTLGSAIGRAETRDAARFLTAIRGLEASVKACLLAGACVVFFKERKNGISAFILPGTHSKAQSHLSPCLYHLAFTLQSILGKGWCDSCIDKGVGLNVEGVKWEMKKVFLCTARLDLKVPVNRAKNIQISLQKSTWGWVTILLVSLN